MTRLQEILEIGFETRTYSGRGMNGKYCLAVSVDDSRGNPIAYVAGMILEELEHVSFQDIQEIADAVKGARSDQLGKGHVVYFPDVEYEKESEADE